MNNKIKLFLLVLLCMMNFIVMHMFFVTRKLMETELYLYSFPVNFFSCILDLSLFYIGFLLLTKVDFIKSLLLLCVTTWILSFVNVFYGKFFSQYLSLSAIFQIGSLSDDIVLKSILGGFQYIDLYYFFTFASLFYLFKIAWKTKISISRGRIIFVLLLPVLSIVFVFFSYSLYHFCNANCRNNFQLFKFRINNLLVNPTDLKDTSPNSLRYHSGLVRPFFAELNDFLSPYELTNDQKAQIKTEYRNLSLRTTNHICDKDIKNVIFILLESFMSSVSDLRVDGKRVTPFLDSLKCTDNVFYNGHVHSNVTIGESGDGQLIYMTGLLPLRSVLSVGIAKKDTLPSLPNLLKNKMGIARTEIVIPSRLGMWQQEAMNKVYGIDYCYSEIDAHGLKMTDKVVFDIAKNTSKSKFLPFYSMVLSLSTHQPYRELVDPNFEFIDDSYPYAYLVYLNACHFVDSQIRSYFEDLKRKNVYSNSLIIIASDHPAHLDMLGMKGRISDEMPLYIVNGDIKYSYKGDCNQLDVFTTVLDVLNIESDWHGFGHSLLDSNYVNSVSDRVYEMSEWIIKGNYFSTKDH